MKYQVLEIIKIKTPQGVMELQPGQVIKLQEDKAVAQLEQGKIRPINSVEFITTHDWLSKLSDSEREIFEERSAIMEFDGKIERERAEVEAIKLILAERVITGKCDKCFKMNGCIMTPGQRTLCEGPLINY